MADTLHEDNMQHGIDDSPTGDAEKGAALGGIGGAVTGGIAGSMAGPVGTVVGAAIGAVAGAAGSGAAVAAVDQVDNDNTISGIGDGATRDVGHQVSDVTHSTAHGDGIGNDVSGVQTGGVTTHGQDTRGVSEKTADAITGDRTDDKTGGTVL